MTNPIFSNTLIELMKLFGRLEYIKEKIDEKYTNIDILRCGRMYHI